MEYLSLLKRNLAVSDPYSIQRLQQEKNALNSVHSKTIYYFLYDYFRLILEISRQEKPFDNDCTVNRLIGT